MRAVALFLGISALGLSACSPGAVKNVNISIESVEEVVPAQLEVVVLAGGCLTEPRLEVRENSERVQVRAVADQKGGDCNSIGIEETLTHFLDNPVGDRELLAVNAVSSAGD